MPRGLSWQQRAVLERLAKHKQPVPLVWLMEYEPAFSLHYDAMADREEAAKRVDYTTRRAMQRLASRGLVDLSYHWFSKELVARGGSVETVYHLGNWSRSQRLLAASLTKAGQDVVDAERLTLRPSPPPPAVPGAP